MNASITPNQRALRWPSWLLAGMLILFGVVYLTWLKLDHRSPGPDATYLLSEAIAYADAIKHFSPRDLLMHLRVSEYIYPPLQPLATAIALAFHSNLRFSAAINLFWIALAIFFTYRIGTRVGGSPVGLLSAFLLLTSPMVVALSHENTQDLGLVGLVAILLWAVVRLNLGEVSPPRAFWIISITTALGLLEKPSFAVYMAAPATYVLLRHFRKLAPYKTHFVVAAIAGIVLAALWYVPHWHEFVTLYKLNQSDAIAEHDPSGWSLTTALYYLNALQTYQLNPLTFFLLPFALVSALRSRKSSFVLLIVTWLAANVLLTTMFANKDVRHSTPVLAAVCILLASWTLTRARFRAGWVALLLAGSLLFAGVNLYGIPRWPRTISFHAGGLNWIFWNAKLYDYLKPHRQTWQIEEMLMRIQRSPRLATPSSTLFSRLGIVPYFYHFNFESVRFYAKLKNLPLEVVHLGDASPAALATCQFVLLGDGSEGIERFTPSAQSIAQTLLQRPDLWQSLQTFPLPDGHRVTLYEKISRPTVPSSRSDKE